MPRKKKDTSNSVKTKKSNKKESNVITSEGLEVTNSDIEDVQRFHEDEKESLKENPSVKMLNEDEFVGEKVQTKSKKKYYTDSHLTWDCERIIIRINNKDYIRQFPMTVSISKDKLGKKTVYGKNKDRTNKWGKIQQIIEENNDLVFVIEPINVE